MTVKLSADRAQLLIKKESTPGTAETLAAADYLVQVGNVQVSPGLEFSEQNLALGDLDPQKQFPGIFPCTIRFETLVRASGALGTAPKMGILFEALGMEATVSASTSVAYDPASPNPNGSYTVGALLLPDRLTGGNDTGGYWRIKGAVCRMLEVAISSGQLIRCTWEMVGAFVSYTDQNAFTGYTHDSTAPLVASQLGFTLASFTPQFRTFTLRYENETARIDNPGAAAGAEPSGIVNFVISGRRRITATYDPYETSAATLNALSLMQAGTEVAMTMTAGTASGNKLTLSGPKVQRVGQSFGEREKLIAPSRELQFNRSSGNDAIQFLFV